jgi:uncharacterized protein
MTDPFRVLRAPVTPADPDPVFAARLRARLAHALDLPEGARLRRRFPGAGLVVFGHSHIPLDHTEAGQRIFNPGSPTDRRRQPHGTVGVLEIADGRVLTAAIVPVS